MLVEISIKISALWPPRHFNVFLSLSASTVEQEQIQKKTFTNWVNAQLAKVGLKCSAILLVCQFKLCLVTKWRKKVYLFSMWRFSDSEISRSGWPDLSSPVIAPHCCHEIQIKITKDNSVTELSTVHRRCCRSIPKHESAAQRPLPVEVSFARETGVDTVHGDINIAQRSKGSQHTDRQQQTSAPPATSPAASPVQTEPVSAHSRCSAEDSCRNGTNHG